MTAHTAAAELFHDAVMRDGLPDKRERIGHLAQMLGCNPEASQRVELGRKAQSLNAQQAQTVVLTEPGIIRLENLFQEADTVALVKVLSGDTQNYPKVIYKAEVVKSFKGTTVGQTIYFGPYVGTRLGWEYFLFLRSVAKPLAPNSTSSVNYGTVHYSEVFNEGYSSMETSYECVFDGKDIAQKCGDGARVCTDYIKLPKSLHTSPPMTEDTPFGCRWVRKEAFQAALDTLHESVK